MTPAPLPPQCGYCVIRELIERGNGRGNGRNGYADGRRALRAARNEEEAEPRGYCGPDPDPAAPSRKHRGPATGTSFRRRPIRLVLPRAMPARSGSTGPKSATSCARKWAARARYHGAARSVRARRPGAPMPKWLVIGAIIAVILVVLLMSWLNKRSLEDDGEPAANVSGGRSPAPAAPAAQRPRPRARWCVARAIRRGSKSMTRPARAISRACSTPGRISPSRRRATAPLLKTAKPEALKIMVGNRDRADGRPGRPDDQRRQPAARRLAPGWATPAPAAAPPAARRSPSIGSATASGATAPRRAAASAATAAATCAPHPGPRTARPIPPRMSGIHRRASRHRASFGDDAQPPGGQL